MSAPPDPPRRIDDPLKEALANSQRLGMLGAAPIGDVIAHSEAFVDALRDVSGTVVDLGSGGGVPGLVIAWRRPDLPVVLVDRRQTRTDHLRRLVRRLGVDDRVTVITADAAALPRLLDQPAHAVVARGFGRPQSVLRAAVPILAERGLIVVSEPPTRQTDDRWPAGLLDRYEVERLASHPRVAALRRVPRGTSR